MKKILASIALLLVIFLVGCGGLSNKLQSGKIIDKIYEPSKTVTYDKKVGSVDLSSLGVDLDFDLKTKESYDTTARWYVVIEGYVENTKVTRKIEVTETMYNRVELDEEFDASRAKK